MNDDDLAALHEVFVAETAELLSQMETALLALERRPDPTVVQEVFRIAHTIKGNASMVGLPALAHAAHRAEEVLDLVRSGARPVTPDLVSELFNALDGLRALAIAEAAPAATAPNGDGRTLRIDVGRLDRMLDLVGEIAVARGRVSELLARGKRADVALARDVHRDADRLQSELQELVLKVRMVPIGPVFHRFARTVRDLARTHGKEARLLVDGEGVELDTSVVEPLKGALAHLLRNAVDHGIESAAERGAAGKDPCATIRLSAANDRGSLVVEVADDGAGLDAERIAARAHALGVVPEGATPSSEQAAQLVFAPGFSTAEKVSDLSGRGVGLDVVRRNVEALRGVVEVRSRPGQGLTVTIRLPLTVAILDGFVVTAADARYVLPMESVEECVDAPVGSGGRFVIPLRGAPLPCFALRELFALPGELPPRGSVVVLRGGEARAGILVDGLLGQAQIVLKPLSKLCQGSADIAGSAILGDGGVALVLDPTRLVRRAEGLA